VCVCARVRVRSLNIMIRCVLNLMYRFVLLSARDVKPIWFLFQLCASYKYVLIHRCLIDQLCFFDFLYSTLISLSAKRLSLWPTQLPTYSRLTSFPNLANQPSHSYTPPFDGVSTYRYNTLTLHLRRFFLLRIVC